MLIVCLVSSSLEDEDEEDTEETGGADKDGNNDKGFSIVFLKDNIKRICKSYIRIRIYVNRIYVYVSSIIISQSSQLDNENSKKNYISVGIRIKDC